MQKTALSFTGSGNLAGDLTIPLAKLNRYIDGWLLEGEIRGLSTSTLALQRLISNKLLWFLRDREYGDCGLAELRAFFAYLGRGHKDAGGRWSDDRLTDPMRPSTLATYHRAIRTLFRFLVSEGIIESSPMERVPAPINRADQIQPFTNPQIEALILAAKRSRHPRRDEAIMLFLLDTGVRASELCEIWEL